VSSSDSAGPEGSAGDGNRDVVLVVEQLRRAVPGGIGTYARGLIQGLVSLGRAHPGGPPGGPPGGLSVRLFASGPKTRPDPLEDLGLPVETSRLASRMLVRAWGAGVGAPGRGALVHATSLAAPPSRAPLVVTVHDLCWRRYPDAYPVRGRTWHEAALRRVARRATSVVVPSQSVAGELDQAGLGLEGRVRVIEEGADHLPPPDLEAAHRLLESLGVGGPFLLAVGTLEPRKNLARLADAYVLARQRLPEPWPLVVAGPFGWGRGTRSALSLPRPAPPRLEAAEGLSFAGRVPDATLSALYHLARCCAYVPLAEGFGLPVVEAMRAGTPVVSSAVPSAAGASLLVDPLEVDSIADGLVSAAGDETVRDRLVSAGRLRAGQLTWQSCAEAHLVLWNELVGGG